MNKKGEVGMDESGLIKYEAIQSRIYTIRGLQVMIDRDLASLYDVETRTLNQAVKRNSERFPDEYCFALNDEEFSNWKSQIVMSNEDRMGLRRPPYAFTEQGVAMLSAVLRSETAVKVSIQIINAFVTMRRFIAANALIFQRLDTLETKQLVTDKKIDHVLNAIESKEIQLKQGIFFDAYKFVADLIRTAQKSIILIDNYIDDSVLTILTKRRKNVKVILLTKSISNQMALDVKKYNEQYPAIEIKEFKNSHDRFIIIDNTTVYHFGASLKDLGKKWFAFSKMDIGAIEMLARLEGMKA
ncbi:MAG: ORF6N domain-containing protein [Candidatus Methanoperedenaceae archaeon]|nr:ORF6N domain-containing protein [Candidatus Methanoperedenaceae archaeon]